MNTPTPRTDTATQEAIESHGDCYGVKLKNFARTLKRELNAANAKIAKLEKDKARLRTALQRIWDEDECGWIINGDKTVGDGHIVECVKCGAYAYGPNSHLLIKHEQNCFQGFIYEALNATAIDAAMKGQS